MLTARLEPRPPSPEDRPRFVGLFRDDDFMIFTGGPLSVEAAARRFDDMLERVVEFPFAKQPVVERSSGTIVGYVGVDRLEFEGQRRLEFGYRLVPEARRRGYATEAGQALLAIAAQTFCGELLAVIHPTNIASIRTSQALGFRFWKQAAVEGELRYLGRREIGARNAADPSENHGDNNGE